MDKASEVATFLDALFGRYFETQTGFIEVRCLHDGRRCL